MSPPTRQFHRLSIGQDMQEPRAQSTRTTRTRRPDPSDDDESGREGENETSSGERESEGEGSSDDEDDDSSDGDESTSASTVLARSGITYDLSSLDTESEAKALVGLTGQFDVLNCRTSSAGYDFQLLDRPKVHISAEAPTCTCSTFQGRPGTACQHIFVSVPIPLKGQVGRFPSANAYRCSGCSTSSMATSFPSPHPGRWLYPVTAALACTCVSRNFSRASSRRWLTG